MKLLVEKINDKAQVPVKAYPSDSGFDVFAQSIQKVYVHAGGNEDILLDTPEQIKEFLDPTDGTLELPYLCRALIGTGLRVTAGEGYEIQVRPRSGNALKRGLTVANTPGTIDESYRGSLDIIIINLSRKTQKIAVGEKIAQIVVQKVELPEIEVVEKLPVSKYNREENGFGSTDRLDRKGRKLL